MSDPLDNEQRQPLNNSISSIKARPAVIKTPPRGSSTRHRPGYARVPSVSFMSEPLIRSNADITGDDDITQAPREDARRCGLAIEGLESSTRQANIQNIRRVPIGGRGTPEQHTPESSRALQSPPSTGGLSGSTRYEPAFDDLDTPHSKQKHVAHQPSTSLNSNTSPSLYQNSERALLHKSATASVRQQFDDFAPRHVCTSSRYFKKGIDNWLAISILVLSMFSAFFSAAFLIIALHGPRYDGKTIGPNGALTVSNAAFLTSLLAKLIELSFVTIVVAFLGQALARRVYKKEDHHGVTLAEMRMRSWITQPGTIFIQWETVRHAGISALGLLALLSAVFAILYTSAATALVQPQLKFSSWEQRALQSKVWTSFANTHYIQEKCKTPIPSVVDDHEQLVGNTCISIEHASQAHHNYHNWIDNWTKVALSGNGTHSISARPKGWALLNDNTTVTAPWIEQQEPYLYSPNGWFINNVTMAMPHAGVVSAGSDPANVIMQPDELNGVGIYSIRASVPVPFVNVICAMGVPRDDLKNLVYTEWDEVKGEVNVDEWPSQLSNIQAYQNDPYLGGTPFDDIFRWGPKWGTNNWPPIFPKLPKNFNSLVNDSTNLPWGRVGIYVLGKGGRVDAIGTPTDNNYALCDLRVGQTPHCSTQYNASSNVGTLEAICEDPNDDMRYIKSLGNATSGNASVSLDWPNIASMWASSKLVRSRAATKSANRLSGVNLNDGKFDGDSANVRLWSQFILTNASTDWTTMEPALSMALPSPAEALAVMSGCTLLQSAQDAHFVEFWNYSSPSLNEGQTQWFNASVRAQQYFSGGTLNYQKGFFIVLFGVFAINVIVLSYWFLHREWYNDFSDPTNLFSLAINSPPSEKLAGCSCGSSPNKGEQSKYYWKLSNDSGHVYIESPEIDEMEESPRLRSRPLSERFEQVTNPVLKAAGRWQKK